jgi:hypothetical protein
VTKGASVGKISRFLRPSLRTRARAAAPADEDLQRLVYELVHDRLMRTLGPDGSFAVTIRRPNDDDALFATTLAESIAWDVASTLRSPVVQPAHLVA